jgi:integrase
MSNPEKKVRGVFEKVIGSGQWWIQFWDAQGRRRREKAGTKRNAIALYHKRKTETLQGKKLPETLRRKQVRFSELAADATTYCKVNNRGQQFDLYRIGRLVKQFGSRPAEIPIDDLRQWFDEQDWKDATYNRYKTMLSLIYRLGMENGKIQSNPARLLRRKREDNGRVRFLNQFEPRETETDYLKDCNDEESRLRAVIGRMYPAHLPEFEIAVNTGMRPSEQYALTWDRVHLGRRQITIPKSKNGKTRHIPLNSAALAAFNILRLRATGDGGPVSVNMQSQPLRGYKHWFNSAVSDAGLKDFTWYCLRHTFASRLTMAGVDLRTVAELMGHKTIQMTMRYAHLAPAHQLAAVERLISASQAVLPGGTGAEVPHRVAPMPAPQPGPSLSEPSATPSATTPRETLGSDLACWTEVLDKVKVVVNVGA